MQCFKSAGPEFRREVQPPTSLNGLDVPSRRAVLSLWKPSRRRGSEWETRLSVEEPMLSTGLHFASESTATSISIKRHAARSEARGAKLHEQFLAVDIHGRDLLE